MKNIYITLEMLEEKGACEGFLDLFEETFPNGVFLSELMTEENQKMHNQAIWIAENFKFSGIAKVYHGTKVYHGYGVEGKVELLVSDDSLHWRTITMTVDEYEKMKKADEKRQEELKQQPYQIEPYYDVEMNSLLSYIEQDHSLMSEEQKNYMLSIINQMVDIFKAA